MDTFKLSAGSFDDENFLRDVLRAMRGSSSFQKRIMTGLGTLALGYAQQAFDRQALGTQLWSPRYPKQTGAKVNIAGILNDFNEGKRNPPAQRFIDRPAGIDTGTLKRSLTPEKALSSTGFSVTIGSVQQNASAVQFGAESRQEVRPSAVKLLADFMRKSRKRIKKAKGKSQPVEARDAAIQQLGFLFGLEKKGRPLITKSGARPYLGVTNELEDKMVDFIVEEFEEFDKGANGFKKA